jgi:hypothetical protein
MFNTSQRAADQSTSQLQADAQINVTNGDSKSEKYRNSNITKKETSSNEKSSLWTGIGSFFHFGKDSSTQSIYKNKDNYSADSIYQYGQMLSDKIIGLIDKNTTAILIIIAFYWGGRVQLKRIKKYKSMLKKNE